MDNETKIQEQFRQAGTSQEEKSTKWAVIGLKNQICIIISNINIKI